MNREMMKARHTIATEFDGRLKALVGEVNKVLGKIQMEQQQQGNRLSAHEDRVSQTEKDITTVADRLTDFQSLTLGGRLRWLLTGR